MWGLLPGYSFLTLLGGRVGLEVWPFFASSNRDLASPLRTNKHVQGVDKIIVNTVEKKDWQTLAEVNNWAIESMALGKMPCIANYYFTQSNQN